MVARAFVPILLALLFGCHERAETKSGDKLGEPAAEPKKKRTRGIQGQAAPPWKVGTWFNVESGARPELSDYRGKVVFLFFFQSW